MADKMNIGVYKKPNNRRYNGRQNEYEGVYRPVYG